mmetsp:Transcript_22288/g.78105  ORF Transcript_22288/g.78105 Transcript_22288/m.78105 type:complete len:234 (+) Transcript_22288:3-704(+)
MHRLVQEVARESPVESRSICFQAMMRMMELACTFPDDKERAGRIRDALRPQAAALLKGGGATANGAFYVWGVWAETGEHCLSTGRYAESEVFARAAVASTKHWRPDRHDLRGRSLGVLANAIAGQGPRRIAEAEAVYAKALRAHDRSSGGSPDEAAPTSTVSARVNLLDKALVLHNWAHALYRQGRYEEPRRFFVERSPRAKPFKARDMETSLAQCRDWRVPSETNTVGVTKR